MLTNRQLLILQTIIDNFIESAHPVGSRAISKNETINLSAATIRNVMADLEDLELLEKTHSSSGRVPSEKGYRYYVDHVIGPTIKRRNLTLIKDMLKGKIFELEHVVQLSAELLSELTNYTTIILGPNVDEAKLKNIQIISLNPRTAVAILITDTGHVEHKSFSIPAGLSMTDLEKTVNILNDRLIGVPIMQLSRTLKTEVYDLMKKHIKEHEQIYEYIQAVLTYDERVKLYVGGKSNMLKLPEFSDVKKVYDFYTMLEDEAEIIRLLTSEEDGLNVSIGAENTLEAIKDFSLITSTFELGVSQSGTIALLGPMRMKYRKVMPLLHALAIEMSDLLNDSNGKTTPD